MDTVSIAQGALWIRKTAIGAHGFVGAWMLAMGSAHQIAVLWKARAGTLTHPNELFPLLAVGVGLVGAGALLTLTVAPLAQRGWISPALGAVALFGGVLAAINARYGFTFLGFSTLLAGVDALALVTFAATRALAS